MTSIGMDYILQLIMSRIEEKAQRRNKNIVHIEKENSICGVRKELKESNSNK